MDSVATVKTATDPGNEKTRSLEEAIESLRSTLETNHDDHEKRAKTLIDLGRCIHYRFDATGSWSDLDEAITVAHEAMLLLTADDEALARLLVSLATRLRARFEHSEKLEDIEEAVASSRHALSLTSKDGLRYMVRSLELALSLELLAGHTHQENDLEQVVRNARNVVNSITGGQSDYHMMLTALGKHYQSLYRQKREEVDLREALNLSRKALSCTTDEDRNEILVHLVGQLMATFERDGDESSLGEAISHSRILVRAGHDVAITLLNLGLMLWKLYERNPSSSVLEESIQASERALLMLQDHDARASCLSNLGCALIYRYGRYGDLDDLNRAIDSNTKAVEESGSTTSRVPTLSNLSAWLYRRYERTRELNLLEEAIRYQRQIFAIRVSRDDPQFLAADSMANLASFLSLRHKRSKRIHDLDEARILLEQAVRSANPKDPARRAIMVGNLASCMFEWHQAEEDRPTWILEEAIALALIALKHSPRNDVTYTGNLINIAAMFHQRFKLTNNARDLDEAIAYDRQALDMTTTSHPEHGLASLCLGSKLASRWRRTRNLQDLEDAMDNLHETVEMSNAQPINRIKAAARIVEMALKAGDTHVDLGIQAGERVLDFLPAVNLRILNREDQQHVVSEFAGIASNLLALYIAAGRVSDGLQNFERARTIIIGQILDFASDLSDLETSHARLVNQFRASQARIDATFTAVSHTASQWDLIKQREEAMDMFHSTLTEIRSLEGHERFLMGLTTTDMQQISGDGWIVVINVTSNRSDAILISRTGIKAIPLPDLDFSTARAYNIFKKGKRNAENLNPVLTRILKWLWDKCVKMVIQEIMSETSRRSQSLSDKRPRVWWIGVGLASWMPFHAAGHHQHVTRNYAMAHIISSYTPSFRALQHSQRRTSDRLARRLTEDPMLLITMPETPGKTKRYTSSNADLREDGPNVESAAGPYVAIKTLVKPAVRQVMGVLGDYPIVHFGCHGESDREDPSDSHMILRRVDSESGLEKQDYLTLRHISRLQLPRAHLAYLSACSTAENSVENLSDEVLHLVSGFQVAGFPHVIGCLWEANDDACLEVSRHFYTSFLKDGLNAASALHNALEALLLDPSIRRDPAKWAPFVYFGS